VKVVGSHGNQPPNLTFGEGGSAFNSLYKGQRSRLKRFRGYFFVFVQCLLIQPANGVIFDKVEVNFMPDQISDVVQLVFDHGWSVCRD
jgi:hypothetical protein